MFRGKYVLTAALVLALPLLMSAAPNKAEKVASKFLDFDEALQAAATQIETTLTSMNALAAPEGDLMAKYKSFTKDVDKLQKMAEKAKSNSQAATSQREDYLNQWKKAQDKIQNPELKAASEARRNELAPKIDAIKTSLAAAKESFLPFMQDLKDLTVFLGNSLNAGGISSAAPLMAKCNETGNKVKSDIASASAALRDLASTIQPGGGTASK